MMTTILSLVLAAHPAGARSPAKVQTMHDVHVCRVTSVSKAAVPLKLTVGTRLRIETYVYVTFDPTAKERIENTTHLKSSTIVKVGRDTFTPFVTGNARYTDYFTLIELTSPKEGTNQLVLKEKSGPNNTNGESTKRLYSNTYSAKNKVADLRCDTDGDPEPVHEFLDN